MTIFGILEPPLYLAHLACDVDRRFDTTGYPEELPIRAGVNKKVIGVFKDEASGICWFEN